MAGKNNSVGKGSGKRRRWGGAMGVRVKTRGKWTVKPRSQEGGKHSVAARGFTCGDTAISNPKAQASPQAWGPYKVPAPTKRFHRKGFYRSAV